MPIASAQVKSSNLIAGLHCDDETSVIETVNTRNHTEKMLGLPVKIIDEKNYFFIIQKVLSQCK